MIALVALPLAVVAVVVAAVACRQARRTSHRMDQHERALAVLGAALRPPDGGRHLRLVA